MKKLPDILFYIWVICALILICYYAYKEYEVRKEGHYVEYLAVKETSKEKAYYDGDTNSRLFRLEGNVKDGSMNLAARYYKAVPWEIRRAFFNGGWLLILTDKDISRKYYSGEKEGELAGLTIGGKKKIYINEKKRHIRRAMIHEFGHFVDFDNGLISYKIEFQEIFKTERVGFKEKWKIDDHATSNSMEYFAESFQQYILYPENLKKCAPLTYEYMRNIIKSY